MLLDQDIFFQNGRQSQLSPGAGSSGDNWGFMMLLCLLMRAARGWLAAVNPDPPPTQTTGVDLHLSAHSWLLMNTNSTLARMEPQYMHTNTVALDAEKQSGRCRNPIELPVE